MPPSPEIESNTALAFNSALDTSNKENVPSPSLVNGFQPPSAGGASLRGANLGAFRAPLRDIKNRSFTSTPVPFFDPVARSESGLLQVMTPVPVGTETDAFVSLTQETQRPDAVLQPAGRGTNYTANDRVRDLWDDSSDRFGIHFQAKDPGHLPGAEISSRLQLRVHIPNNPVPSRAAGPGRFISIGSGNSAFSRVAGTVAESGFGVESAPKGVWLAKLGRNPPAKKDPYDFETEAQGESRYPFGGGPHVAYDQHPPSFQGTQRRFQMHRTKSVLGNMSVKAVEKDAEGGRSKRHLDDTLPYADEADDFPVKRPCPNEVQRPQAISKLFFRIACILISL